MQNKEQLIYTGLEELLVLESFTNYNNSIVDDALNYSSNSNEIGFPSLSEGVNNIIESNFTSTSFGVNASISNSILENGVASVVTAAKDEAKRFIKSRFE